MRDKRVANVRKYFRDLKNAETILNQPSFEYYGLTTQLATEKLK